MKAAKAVIQAAFVLVAALSLSGCDQLKEIDGLKNAAAADKLQIVDLKVELARVKTELETVNGRLAALESAQTKRVSSTGPPTLSAEQVVMLKKTITQCVQVVRDLEPKHDPGVLTFGRIYAEFDAFYNAASGRVQNNNRYVDQSAVYAFNKCMASEGWPLT